jgi:hypothetical protein
MDVPAPSPDMVHASRRHLTERYAKGVDRLLWDTEKRLLPDLEAIALVNEAVAAGRAETLDLGAALVLIQAARLDLDHLEHETFEGAHAMSMTDEAIAAVLDLPDTAAAVARKRWLDRRQRLPRAEAQPAHRADTGTTTSRTAASTADAVARAGRRASQAAARAERAAERREQLRRGPQDSSVSSTSGREHAARAVAHANESRILADEATEHVALSLLRAADALDRCAKGTEELAIARNDDTLARKADEYLRAALRYRRLAGQYRRGTPPG